MIPATHEKNKLTLFFTLHCLQDRYQWTGLCAIWVEKKTESFHLRNWIWMKICLSPFLTISLIPHTTPTSQVWLGNSLTVFEPVSPNVTILCFRSCKWRYICFVSCEIHLRTGVMTRGSRGKQSCPYICETISFLHMYLQVPKLS